VANRGAALNVTMLNAVTTAVSSGAIPVGFWSAKSVQISIAPGTCTAYSLVIEGMNGGDTWATIATKAQSDAGQGQSIVVDLTAYSVRWIQTRVASVTDCTISTFLTGIPN
jgi:hypothetical protein